MRVNLYIFSLCIITLLATNAIAKAYEESDAANKVEELLSVDTGVEHSDEKPRLVRQFGFGGPGFGGPGFGGPGFGGPGFGGPGFGGPGFGGPRFGPGFGGGGFGPGFGGPGFGRPGFGGPGFGGGGFGRRRRFYG